ncbi:MAG: spermidine dehydrogenase [Paraglaciecola psychrophila]|jgi:spermidine dehydrogenase
MTIKITRRDLVNSMAIGVGGLALNAYGGQSAQPSQAVFNELTVGNAGTYYPPTLTGLRGSHKGSFEVAHALAWRGEKPAQYNALDQHYDLVIVGAGMSGLAAAWYYRQKMGNDTRILLLDNHDDFGGHAKRNEFHHEGTMVLGLGGAQNLEGPSNYSEAAANLMKGIGIDEQAIAVMGANTPDNFALGGKLHAEVGMSMPTEDGHLTLGGHWLKFFHGRGNYTEAVRMLPFASEQQDRLIAFFGGEYDYLDDLSLTEKYAYANTVSYNRFLIDKVGLTEQSAQMIGVHLRILNGPSGWNHTVFEAIASGAPGLRAMGWLANLADSLGAVLVDHFAATYMFPDGNASVARLLVQQLIPAVAPAMKGFDDVAVTQFNYAALDPAEQATRIRLNSTVVGVREVAGDRVEVDYVQQGVPSRITTERCILACYNALIPHLCPEMSEQQKAGLRYGVKIPFVYANVLLKNGRAFSKLGVTLTQCPYDSFQWVSAAPTMTTGGYQPPRNADDPMAVLMMGTPTPATQQKGTARDLFRIGRHKIYSTTFEQYEQDIRQQLQALLGQHGFDHEADIRAITVNRIPHGYAYWYMGLDDPEWEEGQAPHQIGRAKFGRISIANSDSEATPLMDAAFDAAFRAVAEQT